MTARGNLVAVITNGTAVLGLGNIGPLAGKPVMEGKGVLFQKFAGIDVFDIEIDETDPDKLVDIIASLEPTFGGINLEDIKAPECFIVERKLRERMKIPVFHDDQHGTAIIVGAAMLNALEVVGKNIGDVKLATTGAGAAGIACLDMLVALGLKPREHPGRRPRRRALHRPRRPGPGQGALRARHRQAHAGRHRRRRRHLPGPVRRRRAEAGDGRDHGRQADHPGAGQSLSRRSCRKTPSAVRPDCIIATGRSDYPNQVNNALCFPYIFRGALDVGATDDQRGDEDSPACTRSPRWRAREASDLGSAYGGEMPCFGPEYLIPRPFDPRLLVELAPARGPGGDGLGRGHAPDRRHGRLPREAGPVRLPHRPDDEAGVTTARAPTSSAWSMPKARRKRCCARCRRWSTKAWPSRS